tara:strand:+ start:895 stop:1221 length:327 start_codon:yes stop_codon:yes gene_type:complete
MSTEGKSENFLTNGNLINRHANHQLTFKAGDKFFIENESYLGDFLVQAVEKDSGSTFVRATGASAGGDAIFDLAYLRRQYTLGKIRVPHLEKAAEEAKAAKKEKKDED